MTVLYAIIAGLVCLLLGITVAIFGFFLWYMLKVIREVKTAVEGLTTVSHELLGEGSFARMSKSATVISSSLPELLSGFKEFSRVMSIFHKTAFEPGKVAEVATPEADSAFYPYSEERAAEVESRAKIGKDNLILTEEQLRHMRTETGTSLEPPPAEPA